MDLPSLIQNKVQFPHTIDELIAFDAQLKAYVKSLELRGESTLYSCLHIICENPALFAHWLSLERQICQKKVDLIFSGLNQASSSDQGGIGGGDKSSLGAANGKSSLFSEKATEIWSCNYADVDMMKPPNCAESFILMIKAIKERYTNLPYPSRKLQFVDLQLDVLVDFHLRLCQIIRDESKTPFSKNYLGVLNTVNYIIYVLDEWKNSPVF